MAKKMMSGNGWSFEPAGSSETPHERVSLPDEKQKATIQLERRAKGKEVTVVKGFVLSEADRAELARKLRKSCGAGGSDADEIMEIQGDHREKIASVLGARGWVVRVR